MRKVVLTIAILLFASQSMAMDVTLGWDANSEQDLAGYRLYWAYSAGVQSTTQTANKVEIPLTLQGFTPAAPQFQVTGLPNDKEVYFVVTAYDTEGLESGFSNEVKAASWLGVPPKSPILRLLRWLFGLSGGLQQIG